MVTAPYSLPLTRSSNEPTEADSAAVLERPLLRDTSRCVEMELLAASGPLLEDRELNIGASLACLPKTALLLIWRHLEYSQLRNAARTCKSLYWNARALPLRRIGAPMVLSALLDQRMHEGPTAEAALLRFRARRTLWFIVYLLLMFVAPSILLLCFPPYFWYWDFEQSEGFNGFAVLGIIYSDVLTAWAIAAFAPLRSSSSAGSEGRERLYFQLRAPEEYYTDSQWKMVRQIWVSFSTAALLCPLVAICHPATISIALVSPLIAAVGGVVAVRREFPPCPLRRSICLQVCHVSILIFFALCTAASYWEEMRDGASHLGFVAGGFWCVLTALVVPKVVKQLQARSTNTWPPAGPPVPATVGTAVGASDASFAARRRRWLRCVLYASRAAVMWVAVICIFLLLRRPPPPLLLALPPAVSAVIGSLSLLYAVKWPKHTTSPRR